MGDPLTDAAECAKAMQAAATDHDQITVACSEEATALGKGHWAHNDLLAEGDQLKVSPGRWPASPGMTP